MKKHKNILFGLGIFSVSMAFLEAAVVYYLRMLYYPEGFAFPLQALDLNVAAVEIAREFATLLMLLSLAYIAGKTLAERFAYFLFCFAVWDIFYYVFLYITLSWPESLFTMDVLFLIPLTWVGPVLAPVINSLMMIILAIVLLNKSLSSSRNLIGYISWMMLISGSIIIIYAYVIDYTLYMTEQFSLFLLLFPYKNSSEIISFALEYIPGKFDWWVFFAGCYLHLNAIVRIHKRGSGRKDKW